MPTVPHEGPTRFISIKVLSSKSTVEVIVDGKHVYSADNHRGMHVVILSQVTVSVQVCVGVVLSHPCSPLRVK